MIDIEIKNDSIKTSCGCGLPDEEEIEIYKAIRYVIMHRFTIKDIE